eukprot:CAMPEP_0175920572 /NCGR_PEP_ID=MMETSP0108-20121206/12998_1 /TAXON_ID=195067 ORGANISM="Goniomonas pacifica, Strain CCMP1869" /NCGR_SAMPLE_ID=MMETSP0108 /ASSEMBLY_ACC=CAM_ASM_000204 /LENGTH=115 /DNA_ID=CAMNT_0017243293 /DNA_START=455 /DNA_END=803 /DNA_ORIENTATION=+
MWLQRDASSIPIGVVSMAFLTSLSWVAYGKLVSDPVIFLPNACGTALSALQLSLYWLFPGNKAKVKGAELLVLVGLEQGVCLCINEDSAHFQCVKLSLLHHLVVPFVHGHHDSLA